METILGNLPDSERSVLFNEGVYVGNIFNFIKQDEVEIFERLTKDLQNYIVHNRDSLVCRYDYERTTEEINSDIPWKHAIPLAEVPERDKFVKENNRFVQQIFLEFGHDTVPPQHEDVKFVMEVYKRIVEFFYPHMEIHYPEKPMFMLYEDGHFISEHRDGKNPGRVCVLIFYLSDEKDYNNGGGELISITNSGKRIETKPVFSTFSMMDFTANDPMHSVNMVKNGFKRLSSIFFLYEKDKQQ
jgi:hypothetical protein